MRLLGVEATDFLSYRRLDVNLSDVHQLAILGKNGHGKSAILDAVLWCLFAKGRGSTDEMVREGAASTYVRTTWERTVKDRPSTVVITRSRSRESDESSLSVTVDGEERTKSRIPLTQAYIEHLVGMGAKAMLAGPVMVQGDSAALLEAQPAARKDLLVELFQLERWEAYHVEAKRRRSMVQKELDLTIGALADLDGTEEFDELALQAEIAGLRSEMQAATTEMDRVMEEVTVLREQAAVLQERSRRAEALGSEIAVLSSELLRLEQERDGIAVRIGRHRQDANVLILDLFPEPDGSDVDSLRHDMDALDSVISERKAAVSTASQLRRQIGSLQARASATSPCAGNPPGCQYIVAAKEASRELADLQERIDGLEQSAAGLQELLYQRSEMAGRMATRQRQLKTARDEYLRVSTLRSAAIAKRAAAEEALADAEERLPRVEERIAASSERSKALQRERLALLQDEYAMDSMAEQITALTAQGTSARARTAELAKAILTAERFRDEMRKAVERRGLLMREQTELESRAGTLDALVKAFHRDGIPTLILETALPEIEDRANDVLSRLPDDYSLRLDTRSATKSGTFKDELRVTVMTGGRERAYHMLSGGQRFRVDFAMRIALAAVIAARVEATVDTLWLDEPLGPLDREGQEAVADTLAAVAEDFGLIAVVSHVPDFNDRFEARLVVTMEDGESTAVFA